MTARASWLRFARFIWQRHRWTAPLCLFSVVFFARLALELQESDLDAFDAQLQRVVDGFRGTNDALMLFLTEAGSFVPMTLLALTVLISLITAGRPREARYLVWGALGTVLLNVLLKLMFHRARPHAELPYLIVRPTSFSFPSGHTMGSAGVIGSLSVLLRVLRKPRWLRLSCTALAALFCGGVGLSRVYLGAHFPSDVLAGWFATAAWLSAITGWFYPRLLPHERAAHREGSDAG